MTETRVVALTRDGQGRCETGEIVPRMLPGEVVDLSGDKPRIVTPSPDRVKPPCPHYTTCGGCSLQHMRPDAITDWKVDMVRKGLAAQGLTPEIEIAYEAQAHTRRRAKFTGRRTKSGAFLGFHTWQSDAITDVRSCLLLTPALNAVMPELRALTKAIGTRKDDLAVTVIESLNGLDVAIEGAAREDAPVWAEITRLAQTTAKIARVSLNGEVVIALQAPEQAFGPGRVVPPPGAFLQATKGAEEVMLERLRAGLSGAKRVADLFAGCGTFSLLLSQAAEVLAVEGLRAPLEALDQGWRQAQGVKHMRTEQRDLMHRPLNAAELRNFDAVVIDPPRAGAEAQVEQLTPDLVPCVMMVSCNPVTFARDARKLVAQGYEMRDLALIDQFRWSYHAEVICKFARAGS